MQHFHLEPIPMRFSSFFLFPPPYFQAYMTSTQATLSFLFSFTGCPAGFHCWFLSYTHALKVFSPWILLFLWFFFALFTDIRNVFWTKLNSWHYPPNLDSNCTLSNSLLSLCWFAFPQPSPCSRAFNNIHFTSFVEYRKHIHSRDVGHPSLFACQGLPLCFSLNIKPLESSSPTTPIMLLGPLFSISVSWLFIFNSVIYYSLKLFYL